MAAVTPVANVEALERAIQRSGLLSADGLAKVHELAARSADPKQFAKDLIKNGTLTRWQAEQLLHGFHRLIVGKYKLLDQIAASPTGRIYLVEHIQIGRRHALKVLAKRLASNPQAVKRFLAAAQTACGLDHRNISHCYDVNQDDERQSHYVVMEHVEGESLERLVERTGRLDPQAALNYAVQAADGLAHAHQNGVVHGDLKPANLIVDPTGTIKILEMGQASSGAAFEAEGADEAVEMAALAAVIFQPPELRGDGESPNIPCDIYSLGSILTYLLTAQAAPDAATACERIKQRAGVPPELAELCRHMMAENPAERPKSVSDVADELVACAQQLAATPSAGTPTTDGREAATAKSGTKAKKPPVAKPLDDRKLTPIVIPGVTHAVTEPQVQDPFVIKTRGRVGKKPVAKPTAEPSHDQSTTERPPAEQPTPFTPLVLAGAIGGGAFLVVALLIAVVALLWLVSRRTGSVPGTAPAQVAAIGQAPTAGKVAAQTSPPEESNPIPAADDHNPDAARNPGLELNPTTESTPTATGPTLSPAIPSPVPATPPPPPEDSPANKPIADDAPPEAKPKKSTAKSPPQSGAKPPVVKPVNKTPVKVDPFQGLARAIVLPAPPDADEAATSSAPVSLGPCRIPEGTPLEATLLGGDGAVRGTKHRFELQPQADATNSWNIVLTGVGPTSTLASLAGDGEELQFGWTAEAGKQATVARQLCNCALQLVVGPAQHVLALRTSVLGSPLVVDIDKSSCSVKWNLGDLPANKQLFVEVTRTEEIKRHRQEPKLPVNVGETVTIWTGDKEEQAPLGLSLSTVANARDITVNLQPQVKFDTTAKPAIFKRKEIQALHQQTVQELPYLREQLEQAKRDRPSTNPQKAAIEKPLIEKRKIDTAVQLEKKDALLNQLIFITQFGENFPGTAKVHFRVFLQLADNKIELLRTEDPRPLKGK